MQAADKSQTMASQTKTPAESIRRVTRAVQIHQILDVNVKRSEHTVNSGNPQLFRAQRGSTPARSDIGWRTHGRVSFTRLGQFPTSVLRDR
jgi:hypothetical protein